MLKTGRGLISEGLDRFGWRGAADFYLALQHGNTPLKVHSIENLIPLHVYENSLYIFVNADLPGFMAEEIKVSATAKNITIELILPAGEGENADEAKTRPVFLSRNYALSTTINVNSGSVTYKKCSLQIRLSKDPFARADAERSLPIRVED